MQMRAKCGICWRNVRVEAVKTREKKEHESKVRLTNVDRKNGKIATANERIGKEDGGFARHSVECVSEVDWENT